MKCKTGGCYVHDETGDHIGLGCECECHEKLQCLDLGLTCGRCGGQVVHLRSPYSDIDDIIDTYSEMHDMLKTINDRGADDSRLRDRIRKLLVAMDGGDAPK